MRGVVYFLLNGAMPGLIKVGRTKGNPYTRAFDLSRATGVPEEFRVLAFFEVDDCSKYEREIHRILDEYRNSPMREFFLIDAKTLSNAFSYLSEASIFSRIEKREVKWFNNGCDRAGIPSGYEVSANG